MSDGRSLLWILHTILNGSYGLYFDETKWAQNTNSVQTSKFKKPILQRVWEYLTRFFNNGVFSSVSYFLMRTPHFGVIVGVFYNICLNLLMGVPSYGNLECF